MSGWIAKIFSGGRSHLLAPVFGVFYIGLVGVTGFATWYVHSSMQTITAAMPVSALSRHRDLSSLIRSLARIASALEAVQIEESEKNLDELSLTVDINAVILTEFRSKYPDGSESLQNVIREAENVVERVESSLMEGWGLKRSTAWALLTRLRDIGITLENIYLRANEGSVVEMEHRILELSSLRLGIIAIFVFTGVALLISGVLLIAVWRYLTGLNRARDALGRSERRYRELIEGAPQGIAVEMGGNTVFVNQAFAKMAGFDKPDDMLGAPWGAKFVQPNSREPLKLWQQTTSHTEGDALPIQFEAVRRNGETCWCEAWAREIEWQGQSALLTVIVDISERKQAERLKEEFVSTVNHELRTPLTSIRGALGLVVSGTMGELPDAAANMINLASKNTERLIVLVNDILDVERLRSGRMEYSKKKISVGELIEAAVEANTGYGLDFNVRLHIETLPKDVFVLADSVRLGQVLANLISNAIKFSPSGGEVRLGATVQRDSVRVYVADDGSGIPEEAQGRIFQKFSQVDASDKRSKSGSGLGLSIVKAIVEDHDGSVGLDSAVNQGTTFHFDLPVFAKEAVAPAPDRQLDRPADSKLAILIFSHDSVVANRLSQQIKKQGGTCDIALQSSQALDLLKHQRYGVAIVAIDPQKNGGDWFRPLHAALDAQSTPVIMLSSIDFLETSKSNSTFVRFLETMNEPVFPGDMPKSGNGEAETRLPSILHVEDDSDIRDVLKGLLHGQADISFAPTLSEARTLIAKNRFDLVVLDLTLPDGNGFELIPLLGSKTAHRTPVLVFSASEVTGEDADKADRSILKSRVTNDEIVHAINEFVPLGDAAKKTNASGREDSG